LIERLFMLFRDGISMENERPLTVFAFTMSIDANSWFIIGNTVRNTDVDYSNYRVRPS
jgi:hypothetical protein